MLKIFSNLDDLALVNVELLSELRANAARAAHASGGAGAGAEGGAAGAGAGGGAREAGPLAAARATGHVFLKLGFALQLYRKCALSPRPIDEARPPASENITALRSVRHELRRSRASALCPRVTRVRASGPALSVRASCALRPARPVSGTWQTTAPRTTRCSGCWARRWARQAIGQGQGRTWCGSWCGIAWSRSKHFSKGA